MSWLLFMDESGHDRRQMPYEVRGGVAIQDRRRRSFIRAVESLERDCFGARLADYHGEFNGEKLLDRNRLKRAFSSKMHTAPANHERIKKRGKILSGGHKGSRAGRASNYSIGDGLGRVKLIVSHRFPDGRQSAIHRRLFPALEMQCPEKVKD
jgi:hypothetical protein